MTDPEDLFLDVDTGTSRRSSRTPIVQNEVVVASDDGFLVATVKGSKVRRGSWVVTVSEDGEQRDTLGPFQDRRDALEQAHETVDVYEADDKSGA